MNGITTRRIAAFTLLLGWGGTDTGCTSSRAAKTDTVRHAPVDAPALTPSTANSGGELAGTSWRLVRIMSMDDTTYTPTDPSLYTLELGRDGSATIRADCNRGTGSWSSVSASQLRFGPIAATQALCGPESLHDRYMRQFQWVRSYVMENGHLFLATMADGSIVELEPSAAGPVTATVLGRDIRATNAGELQEAILPLLLEQYAAARGIRATEAEIDAYVEDIDRFLARERAKTQASLIEIDQQLRSDSLTAQERASLHSRRALTAETLENLTSAPPASPQEAAEVDAMRRRVARVFVERWKINRALYRDYGGRIIFQQAGPEPLDATRKFLEQRESEGAFSIRDEDLESAFWRYFRDDSIHSFVEPGSTEEATAFEIPPWRRGPD